MFSWPESAARSLIKIRTRLEARPAVITKQQSDIAHPLYYCNNKINYRQIVTYCSILYSFYSVVRQIN